MQSQRAQRRASGKRLSKAPAGAVFFSRGIGLLAGGNARPRHFPAYSYSARVLLSPTFQALGLFRDLRDAGVSACPAVCQLESQDRLPHPLSVQSWMSSSRYALFSLVCRSRPGANSPSGFVFFGTEQRRSSKADSVSSRGSFFTSVCPFVPFSPLPSPLYRRPVPPPPMSWPSR